MAWKQARWPPLFITFLTSPCTVMTPYQVSSEIYGGFFYPGITLRVYVRGDQYRPPTRYSGILVCLFITNSRWWKRRLPKTVSKVEPSENSSFWKRSLSSVDEGFWKRCLEKRHTLSFPSVLSGVLVWTIGENVLESMHFRLKTN